MKEALKRIADHIPYPIGRALGKIPMSLRLGKAYNVFSENSKKTVTSNIQKNCHFDSIQKILSFSQNNIKFYQDFYKKSDFSPSQFKTIEDISLIPIINKSDLQKYSLLDRSVAGNSLKQSNTGGTTGQPLNFYLEKSAYAREWAHMHAIWKSMGYRYTDEKITIRGKNIGNCYYKYNFNQNEFLINAYAPLRDNIFTCRELITKRNICLLYTSDAADE